MLVNRTPKLRLMITGCIVRHSEVKRGCFCGGAQIGRFPRTSKCEARANCRRAAVCSCFAFARSREASDLGTAAKASPFNFRVADNTPSDHQPQLGCPIDEHPNSCTDRKGARIESR